jgi:putative spermidine/putrescine transport system ATP-binding protein
MNEGEIEQLGGPNDLYFRPESVFAADFLGESNLLDATVASASGDVVQLKGPGDIPIKAPPRGETREGEALKFMIRPENVHVLGAGEEAPNTLVAKVQDVILVGQVTKYYAHLPDGTGMSATELTRHDLPTFASGDEIRFGFDVESTVLVRGPGA